jgi:hypothetical protein
MVPHPFVTRNNLVTALVACAGGNVRSRARRFLLGLSADELQFLAEFLGSCILESSDDSNRAAQMVQLYQARFARETCRRSDHEHKMILLREYLDRTGAIAG